MKSCKKCKKELPDHPLCDVCECNICSRCYNCDARLCRTCDNTTDYMKWFEKDGIDKPDVYWCEKCIKKHTKKQPLNTIEWKEVADN